MRRVSFPALVLSALLALAGCKSTPTKVEPQGEAPVTLATEKKRTEHSADVGNRIVVSLPRGEDASNVWEIAYHDARYLQQLTDFTRPADAASPITISFVAVRPGSTRVRFVLVPANAGREATPTNAHDLVVSIR